MPWWKATRLLPVSGVLFIIGRNFSCPWNYRQRFSMTVVMRLPEVTVQKWYVSGVSRDGTDTNISAQSEHISRFYPQERSQEVALCHRSKWISPWQIRRNLHHSRETPERSCQYIRNKILGKEWKRNCLSNVVSVAMPLWSQTNLLKMSAHGNIVRSIHIQWSHLLGAPSWRLWEMATIVLGARRSDFVFKNWTCRTRASVENLRCWSQPLEVRTCAGFHRFCLNSFFHGEWAPAPSPCFQNLAIWVYEILPARKLVRFQILACKCSIYTGDCWTVLNARLRVL